MSGSVVVPVVAMGIAFMVIERVFPDQELPETRLWWPRAILFNSGQAVMIVLAGLSWDAWLQRASLFRLGGVMPAWLEGVAGYFVATFIYYWWHRARHDINALWLACHQVHHSPARIETITAFYKHPFEVFVNSILSSGISYALLGLTIEGAAWVAAFSGVAEFVYHVNVKTPHWLGYFFQRPEMHRIHHQRGVHYSNFADLPLWDMLFGTYKNPATYRGKCGFLPERELAVGRMLRFDNVNGPLPKR